MKSPRIPLATLILLAGSTMTGCSDAAAPVGRHSAAHIAPLRDIRVNGPEDIPFEDGDSLPPEFNAAPLIQNTTLDSDFAPTFAFGTASMRYFASHARVDLNLQVKRGVTLVDSGSSFASDENLLPVLNTLLATFTLSNAGPCGHRLDAKATYTAWMAFLVPKTVNLFSWGHTTQSLSKPSSQPECPPDDEWYHGGGDDSEFPWDLPSPWDDESEDPYEGSCGLYQLWIATVNGVIVDWWWERTDVDAEFCQDIYTDL